MKVIYLNPKSPVKTMLASDTLFGLLCWGYRMVFSENDLKADILVPCLQGNPRFLISSAFPFTVAEDKKIHFFPKPIISPPKVSSSDIEMRKKLKIFKKLSFLPEKVFLKVVTGELHIRKLPEVCYELAKPGVLRNEVAHNVIDRTTTTTGIGGLFSTECFFFRERAGLFFLLKADSDFEKRIIGVICFMREHGFGGDASIGKGYFEIEVKECPWSEFNGNAERFMTLSYYHPSEDERTFFKQKADMVWYHLRSRKGRVGGGFIHPGDIWKMTSLFFTEGSTFPEFGKEYYGVNPIVKRYPFDVQAYGFAFPIPLHVKE